MRLDEIFMNDQARISFAEHLEEAADQIAGIRVSDDWPERAAFMAGIAAGYRNLAVMVAVEPRARQAEKNLTALLLGRAERLPEEGKQ